MRTRPADLPEAALRAALADGWSLHATTLTYRPVGFGSHHWAVTDEPGARWFVTVDDLACPDDFARRNAALSAAQALRAAGRPFVVAPLPARDGSPVRPLGRHYAVAVYPFVTGRSFAWGEHTPEQHRAVLDLLAAVHTAPPSVTALARADDFEIPPVDVALDPAAGPYAEPAGKLLAAHAPAVGAALARYAALVAEARADPSTLVLTHGEPHPGNTMHTPDGWLLIDWDTVLVAPPERDLWSLGPADDAYTAATGIVPRPALLDLYRLRWHLTDVAVALARFGRPHGDTADDRATWTVLETTVPSLPAIGGA